MPIPTSLSSSQFRIVDHEVARIGGCPARQTRDMRPDLADPCRHVRQNQQGDQGRNAVIDREQNADPIPAGVIGGACRVARSERILGYHGGRIDPHDEQSGPAEELNEREPLHHHRHGGEISDDRAQRIIGVTTPCATDRLRARDAVSDQQRTEQIHFLLQAECRHRDEDRQANRNPCAAVSEPPCRQRAEWLWPGSSSA